MQLTWMDAKVSDWDATPRIGKPIEVNVLWYNVLRTIARMLADGGDNVTTTRLSALADQTKDSIRACFMRSDADHLADVIDGPDGDNWSKRPNQIFALSLPDPRLDSTESKRAFRTFSRSSLTSYGLRSLAPDDPAHRGDYGCDQLSRDGTYHQRPVWSRLLGPYAEASYRIYRDRDAALTILRPIGDHLPDAASAPFAEIFDGDLPYLARGSSPRIGALPTTLRGWRLLGQSPTSVTIQSSLPGS